MDVSEDMILGFDAILNLQQQIDTPRPAPTLALVPMAYRRSVRHENINTLRNFSPLFAQWLASVQVERPVTKTRLPWRPVDQESLYLIRLIFKADTIGEGGCMWECVYVCVICVCVCMCNVCVQS
jgi:hypothetical protein